MEVDPIQLRKKAGEEEGDKCQQRHQVGQGVVGVVPSHLAVGEGLEGEVPYLPRVVVQEEWVETVLEVA